MRRVKESGVALVLLLLAVRPVVAGQDALTLTIESAIERAAAASPRLAEARSREAAAEAAVASRVALGRPVVTASSSVLRTNHVDEFGLPQADGRLRVIFPDIPSNYRARAEVVMPVYTSGRVDALVASAQAQSHAALADRRSAAADLTLDVTTVYWTLVTAGERIGVLERTLQRADAVLADVRARVAAGLLPPNDALTMQAQRARQQVLLIQAQNDARITELQLARLVGAPPGQAIRPVSPLAAPSSTSAQAGAMPDVPPLVAAPSRRPEREALIGRQTALRATADALRAQTRPQLSALAGVEPARPNARFIPRTDVWKTSWDLAVNVSWSLWDSGRSRADAAAASAEAEAVRHRIEDFDAAVAVEVRQRRLEIESTRAAIAASAEAVTASTEARRVVGERFAAGVATSTDVLAADVALLEAELEHAGFLAALRIGEARLARAVGGA